jgi:hypothetical protein
MLERALIPLAIAVLAVGSAVACGGRDGGDEGPSDEVQVSEGLGTLTVMNRVDEPVAIHLDGEELFVVPPGRSTTFRNLPTRQVNIYGVGRVSEKHYGLPTLTIEEGEEYEWTINP